MVVGVHTIVLMLLYLKKMETPSEKDRFFNRFTATKERSKGFRVVVIFLVLLIFVFMIVRLSYHMVN